MYSDFARNGSNKEKVKRKIPHQITFYILLKNDSIVEIQNVLNDKEES